MRKLYCLKSLQKTVMSPIAFIPKLCTIYYWLTDLSKLNSTLQLLDDQYMKMSLSFAANKIEINELREDLNLLKQQIQKKEKVKAIGDAVFG